MVALDNIRIVLVGAMYGGNVGAVCRAMCNMGLVDLALVQPRPLNWDEARWMACHAVEILDNHSVFDSLRSATADCMCVWGTTARSGLYRQHARSAREWAPAIVEAAAKGRVALVFGREDNGLTNEELALCTHLIRIPTAESYPSLNVAQAVLLCAYEVFLAAGIYTPPQEKSPEAPMALKERLFDMWRDMLLAIGFMHEGNADHMMFGLRRVFGRGVHTTDDVRILMGVARQTRWAARVGSCRRVQEFETMSGMKPGPDNDLPTLAMTAEGKAGEIPGRREA